MGKVKILAAILALFLMIPAALALGDVGVSTMGIPPVVSLTADVDNATISATLTAVAVDAFESAGVAWIKLYETNVLGNEVLVSEANCGGQTTCSLAEVVVKASPGGTYTYRADSQLVGGSSTGSDEAVVTFSGVDLVSPEYYDIKASPASPAEYGRHQFNVTWTDNSRIGHVWIEHNFFGVPFTTEVVNHNGDEYYYNVAFVELGDYQWKMYAEDVADHGPNRNDTPMQPYTVVKANPVIAWNATPGWTAVFGNTTSVGCSITSPDNTETELHLYRDGAEVTNPDVGILPSGMYNYVCNATEEPHYNAVSESNVLQVSALPSDVELLLDGASADLSGVERETQPVNITGNLLLGENGLSIYIDGTEVANGTSPLEYITEFNATGDYNVTLVAPATSNYSESSEEFTVSVVDTVFPGSVSGLALVSATVGSLEINWTNPADSDLAGVMVYVNGTNAANVTGGSETYVVDNDGTSPLTYDTPYNITLHTYDNDGNVNNTDVSITASTLPDTTPPQFAGLNVTPANGSTYSPSAVYEFSAEVQDDVAVDTVIFEFDGVNQTVPVSAVPGIYEVNVSPVSGGAHSYGWYANDTSDNWNSTVLFPFTVNPAPSVVNLTLNSQKQNITGIGNVTGVSLVADLLAGDDIIEVWENSTTLLYSGPASTPWTTTLNYYSVGDYNITMLYPASANYSASSESLFVFVQPVINNVSLSYPGDMVTGADMDANYTITLTNTGNVADDFTISVTSFDSDVAVLDTGSVAGLAPGASGNIVLTVRDNETGTYNATVYAESASDPNANETLNIQTQVADLSTVINSTVNGVYYSYNETTAIPQLFAAMVVDSEIMHPDTDINVSSVYRSTIDNSYILDNSEINDSLVNNSILSSCVVINSVLEDIIASNCYVENSGADPSDLTNSTVTGNSDITNSTFTNSIGDNVIVTTSTVDFVNASGSNITDSTATSSVVNTSTVTSTSNIDSSTVEGSNVANSDVTNSDVTSSTIINWASVTSGSTVTGSTVEGANVTNSTVDNSTIPSGVTVDDAFIEDGVIINGTVDGTTYTNATNLTDAVNYPPVAGISPASASFKEGGSATFTSASTDPNEGGLLNDSLSYQWSVGGTPVANHTSPSYTFSSSTQGNYVVTLTVTDSFGASDSINATVSVSDSGGGRGSSRSSGGSRSSGPREVNLINLTPGSYVTLDIYREDRLKFMFDGTEHTMSIRKIDPVNGFIETHIEPATMDVTVTRLKTENINLNEDMLNDISVRIDAMYSSHSAKITFGLKDKPSYDPILIPETGPEEGTEPEPEEEQEPEPEPEQEPEEHEAEEKSLWQRFVEWLKRIFSGDDEQPEKEPEEETEEETGEEEQEEQPEPEQEPEEEQEESGEDAEEPEGEGRKSLWQKLTSWFKQDSEEEPEQEPEEGEYEEEAADEEHLPRPLLGWLLAMLIAALGISAYFVVRKEVMEKRLERYL